MKEADLVRALVLPKVLKTNFIVEEEELPEPKAELPLAGKATATPSAPSSPSSSSLSSSSPSIESLAQIEQQTEELVSEVK